MRNLEASMLHRSSKTETAHHSITRDSDALWAPGLTADALQYPRLALAGGAALAPSNRVVMRFLVVLDRLPDLPLLYAEAAAAVLATATCRLRVKRTLI